MFETVLAVKAAAQAHSSFITNVIVPKFVRVRCRCYILYYSGSAETIQSYGEIVQSGNGQRRAVKLPR